MTAVSAVQAEVEFDVTGMTCGSCAARVERTLSRQEGVGRVAVNLATERAVVAFDPGRVAVDDLVAAVVKAGYGLVPAASAEAADSEDAQRAMWLRRVLVAWPLGSPASSCRSCWLWRC
jgi:copper chaperone CopZ